MNNREETDATNDDPTDPGLRYRRRCAGLAACGSDDDQASPTTGSPSTESVATTETTETTAAPATTATTGAAMTTAATATTDAATTTAAAAPAGDDEQAVIAAYKLVFDSTTGYDAKQPHLEDAAALKATIDNYATAGATVGGIALVPTDVVIDGDTATVTYDVAFAGTVVYGDLEGGAVRTDGTWKVTRVKFCEFMAQAQNPCP